jgi:hypothetical protein
MTGKIVRIGAAVLVTTLAVFATVAVRATDSPDAMAKRKLHREIEQRRTVESKLRTLDWSKTAVIDADHGSSVSSFDIPVVRTPMVPGNGMYSSVGAQGTVSPGIEIGITSYDYQANASQGYQTARLAGNDCVHFCWTAWDRIVSDIKDNDRYVAYNSYTISSNTLNQGVGGVFIGQSNTARGGYTNLDVDQDNLAQVALHQRQDASSPYHCWRIAMPIACNGLHVDDELGGTAVRCAEVLWPRIAASRDVAAGDVVAIHEIGIENLNNCSNPNIYYWRYSGGVWQGPVVIDNSDVIGYSIADCPTNDKVAVVFHSTDPLGLLNVAYYESITAGLGWLNGTELTPSSRQYITHYSTPGGPQAWTETSCTYDNNGVLHVVYLQQKLANNSERITIYHWNSLRNSSRPVALSEYDGLAGVSAFNLNLAKVTVGIGDGSSLCSNGSGDEANNNYVYVTYTKFAGETPAEQADISASGFWNGELYLAVSNSGGNTWSPPLNLTNTKTPNCNPGLADPVTGIPAHPLDVCRSEHWATIGRAVSDIDIFFISDLDAGGIPHAEGTWQLNPVHYLRLPKGTHSSYVCPTLAPVFEATLTANPECEYHSTRTGTDFETLDILNLGNATLSGTISIPTNFTAPAVLTLSGGVGPYSITAGSADVIKGVTMAANNAPDGLYQASISITHNDVTKTNPHVIPIDYFVGSNFSCPQIEVLKTGVGSQSLALQVESSARFASQNAEGGLWRASDSSSSIFDASLLVAHDAQGPDTTVYLRFFNRATNGQRGFRALSDLQIDVSEYGSNTGNATATAYMCTADSVVGIKMSWFFPQDHAKDEYIIAQYKVYRNKPTVPITNLCIGVLEDQDVVPAAKLGSIQTGVENRAGGDAGRKLGYQIGVDTAGAVIVGTNTATRFRGGVAACGTWQGTKVGNNVADIQPGGGPTDGFLYRQLTSLSGVDLFTDSPIDMYTLVSLDKGKSIAAGETLTYALIFASDTTSDASFKATVDAGLAAAWAAGLCGCSCPCQYDPRCDGTISDVLDVSDTINRAFRGAGSTQDPQCPYERTDVDGSGATDVLDVTKVINVAFRGNTVGSQYDLNLCMLGDQ